MLKSPLGMLIVGVVVGVAGSMLVTRLTTKPAPTLAEVMATDSAFSGVSDTDGAKEAFTRYGAPGMIFLPSGGHPLEGSEAVAKSFDEFPPGAKITWKPVGGDIAQSGDLAYTWGNFRMTFAEGEPHYGKYLTVWRRQDDGTWRIVMDTGNASPAPETAAPAD